MPLSIVQKGVCRKVWTKKIVNLWTFNALIFAKIANFVNISYEMWTNN